LVVVTAFYYESDMSESVPVKIYYGIGEIIYGPQGVDLSNFRPVEKNIPRAGERTWEVITNWLVKAFTVDLEHHYRRGFIRNACRVGLPVILFVQTYHKDESSSQVHEEVEDVDEGEGGEEGEGDEEGKGAEEGEQQEEEE
jgi:hypothetical protein